MNTYEVIPKTSETDCINNWFGHDLFLRLVFNKQPFMSGSAGKCSRSLNVIGWLLSLSSWWEKASDWLSLGELPSDVGCLAGGKPLIGCLISMVHLCLLREQMPY